MKCMFSSREGVACKLRDCDRTALVLACWPGRAPEPACAEHATRLTEIGRALGIVVPMVIVVDEAGR